jgi:hypothetical protein
MPPLSMFKSPSFGISLPNYATPEIKFFDILAFRITIDNEQKIEVSQVKFGFGIFVHLFMPAKYYVNYLRTWK